MKPVLSAWPPKKRTGWFGPVAGGIWLLLFLIVALATQNVFLALILPPPLAVAGAWALLGWPEIARKDGKPLVEKRYRPYLFFVLAPIFAIVSYVILGIATTQTLPLTSIWVTRALIAIAIMIGVAGAYFLVGVPNLVASARKQYDQIPPERRPYLFFPITAVAFLILYLGLGVASTALIGGSTGLLNIQVLVLTPICLALAALVAWLLVGIPKPQKDLRNALPKVTGKHRPRVFFATSIVGGIILTIVVGALLTAYAGFLPPEAVLGLALLLGFALSIGIAAVWWGTPARWRRYDDYRPGVHPRARMPLILLASFAVALTVAIGIGVAGIDLFWGLLAGALAGGLALLFLTGSHKEIAKRANEPTLVPDLPDGMKPLILFPTWFVVSGVIFAVLTYLLPGLIPVNLLLAVLVGLGATFFLLEQPLLKDMIAERRRERAKRREWEARRKARLAEAEKAPAPDESSG